MQLCFPNASRAAYKNMRWCYFLSRKVKIFGNCIYAVGSAAAVSFWMVSLLWFYWQGLALPVTSATQTTAGMHQDAWTANSHFLIWDHRAVTLWNNSNQSSSFSSFQTPELPRSATPEGEGEVAEQHWLPGTIPNNTKFQSGTPRLGLPRAPEMFPNHKCNPAHPQDNSSLLHLHSFFLRDHQHQVLSLMWHFVQSFWGGFTSIFPLLPQASSSSSLPQFPKNSLSDLPQKF